MFGSVLFIVNILIISSFQLIQLSEAGADNAPKNYHKIIQGYEELIIEIVTRFRPFHTLILLYDEELDQSRTGATLMQEIHKLNVVTISINIGHNKASELLKTFGTSEKSKVLEALLRLLYSQSKVGTGAGTTTRYFFIVWVANPNILYASSKQPTAHPGWAHFDRVYLFPGDSNNVSSQQDVRKMEFWKHMPRIVGCKVSSKNSDLVNIYLVDWYYGTEQHYSYQNLNVWVTSKKRLYQSHRSNGLSRKRFSTFDGIPLPVGAVWKDPFLIWGNKLHPYMDGLDWRLAKLAEKRLNFTVNLISVEKIGRFENGSWTGLLGMLSTGAVAFAVGGIPVTPERLHDFGFSTTYYTDAYAFISPQKFYKPKLLDVFQQPFQEIVWAVLGITGISIVAALFLLANIEKWILKSQGKNLDKDDIWFTKLENNVAFIVTQLFQKPYHHAPKSNTLKFIFYGVSLGFHIMGIMFVTFMIANISAPRKEASVDKVDDIIPSKISLDIRDYDGELNSFLQRTKPEFWKSAHLVSWLESFSSIPKVSEGSRIYMDSRARLSFMASYEYDKKKLFAFHLGSEDVLGGVNLAWGMRKNWPFHRAINNVIVRAVESGLVQYWMENFKRGKFAWDGDSEAKYVQGEGFLTDWNSVVKVRPPRKEEFVLYKYDPILLKELDGIVLMYKTGCVVAVLLFFLEHVASTLFVLVEMITWLGQEVYQACTKAVVQTLNKARKKIPVKGKLRTKKVVRGKTRKGRWAVKTKYLYGNGESRDEPISILPSLKTKTAMKVYQHEYPVVPPYSSGHRSRNRQGQQSNEHWDSFDVPFNYLK